MDILPISELPQPSLTTEVPQTTSVSLQSLLPPFCNPASQTQLDDYFSRSSSVSCVFSYIPPFSDSFVPNTTSTIAHLPSSLNTLYCPCNEELIYTELLDVCDQVSLTISEAQVQLVEHYA